MDTATVALLDILRREPEAINQQFAHKLALREWSRNEAAASVAATLARFVS